MKSYQPSGTSKFRVSVASPMAFFAKAIESVMTNIREKASEAESAQEIVAATMRTNEALRAQRTYEEAANTEKIAEFESAFPDPVERSREIERLSHDSRFSAERARLVLATQRWSEGRTKIEPDF